jgi:hypothetical protein
MALESSGELCDLRLLGILEIGVGFYPSVAFVTVEIDVRVYDLSS